MYPSEEPRSQAAIFSGGGGGGEGILRARILSLNLRKLWKFCGELS